MTSLTWLICEQTGQWAAALRVALRSHSRDDLPTVVREFRTLDDLAAALSAHPSCIVLVEISAASFERSLNWIAEAKRSHRIPIVALLDRRLGSRPDVSFALREAGVAEIVQLPRNQSPVLAIGRAYARRHSREIPICPAPNEPIDEWAWALLPWQDEERPLG